MFQPKAAFGVSVVVALVSTSALAGVDTAKPKTGDPAVLCARVPVGGDKVRLKPGASKGIIVIDKSGTEPEDTGNSALGEVEGKPAMGSKTERIAAAGQEPDGSDSAFGEVDGKPTTAGTKSGIIVYGKDDPGAGTNRSAASTAPASPGVAVGFNPQPDPPGRIKSSAATPCR